MRFATITTTALAALCAQAALAHAHITLAYPPPRDTGQKTAPCGTGGSTRGSTVTTFQPGETITVEWDETVDHPGHYRIAFDDDGDDAFQNPMLPADDFPSTLLDQIEDRAGGGHYTQQLTLPSTPCTGCTLQLVQVMTTAVPYNSFYYQCADIAIAGDPVDPNPDPDPASTDGGCSTGGGAGLGAGLAAAALLARRRRARR